MTGMPRPLMIARQSKPRSTASGHSTWIRFGPYGARPSGRPRRRPSARTSWRGSSAGTFRSRPSAGWIPRPQSISMDSRGATGHEPIALGASNPAPCSCANTRASGTPSPSLQRAMSGARRLMPASPSSRERSPLPLRRPHRSDVANHKDIRNSGYGGVRGYLNGPCPRVVGVPSQAAIGVALTPAHQRTTEASIRSPFSDPVSIDLLDGGVHADLDV